MSTELIKSNPSATLDLEVTAITPVEMQQANAALIDWCGKKIESMREEAAELAENLSIAIKNKWKTVTLKKHADLAVKRVTFYEKIKAALEAGYCIVPNFPVDLFAIRTDRDKPKQKWHFGNYAASAWNFQQVPGLLPIGEGENKSANPLVQTDVSNDKQQDGSTKKHYAEHAVDFGEIAFPMKMAKPSIMEATSRAMALKIFDQFGLFAQGTGDPIITGEIVRPGSRWHPTLSSRVTFIIAWHLNVRDL